MADATAPGADEASVHISPEVISQQADFQRSGSQQGDRQANPQHADSQHPPPEQPIPQSTTQQAVPRQTAPQPAIFQPTTAIQQTIPQHVTQLTVPQQAAPQATVDQDPTAQPIISQQSIPPRESQLPPSSYEEIAKPILVKTEPLEDVELDFFFAAGVLSAWKPDEECDEELWKRMETTVCPLACNSPRS